jgi:hypothetical protein
VTASLEVKLAGLSAERRAKVERRAADLRWDADASRSNPPHARTG